MPTTDPVLTPAIVAAEVLSAMGVLSAGQTPTADDATLVFRHHNNVYTEWYKRGWIDGWPIEITPSWAFNGLCKAISARVSRHYQGTTETDADALERAAEAAFMRAKAEPASRRPVRVEYF